MSNVQSLSFKWVVGVATGILSLSAVYTGLIASPKDVNDLSRRVSIVEARFEAMEVRSKIDHDLLIRIDQTLQEMKQRGTK